MPNLLAIRRARARGGAADRRVLRVQVSFPHMVRSAVQTLMSHGIPFPLLSGTVRFAHEACIMAWAKEKWSLR